MERDHHGNLTDAGRADALRRALVALVHHVGDDTADRALVALVDDLAHEVELVAFALVNR